MNSVFLPWPLGLKGKRLPFDTGAWTLGEDPKTWLF